jgi:2-hydroxycyclohexanecarboxyl-CoA dehydrogenase
VGRIQGKVAVVLGAAGKNNIGQVIARRFAAEGAKVMVAGRREEPLRALAEEIGGDYALCDITSRGELDALSARTRDRWGRIDVGVNTVGWALTRPFLKTTADEIARISAVQFAGPFQFMQVMIEAMTRGGSIIQISSVSAKIMVEYHAAYMGTKAGADHLVRCVANEFGVGGIRANSISPGLTETPMAGPVFESDALLSAYRRGYPLGRVGTGADIAAAALWLASDECFLTGENLQVNGGLTLRGFPTVADLAAALEKETPERKAFYMTMFGKS